MTATAKPEPFSRVSTEHYDRLEYHVHSKIVEFHVSTTMRSLQAATAAALAEVEALGLDPNELPVMYRGAGRGTGSGIIAYEVERDEPAAASLLVNSDDSDDGDDAAIVARLPRDWPRQLRDIVNNGTQTSGELDDVLRLVDEWVLAASE